MYVCGTLHPIFSNTQRMCLASLEASGRRPSGGMLLPSTASLLPGRHLISGPGWQFAFRRIKLVCRSCLNSTWTRDGRIAWLLMMLSPDS